MYFLTEDDELLEKYDTIWNKFSADVKKQIHGESVYIREFLKTKLKSHRFLW